MKRELIGSGLRKFGVQDLTQRVKGFALKAGVKLRGSPPANGNGIIPATAMNIPFFLSLG